MGLAPWYLQVSSFEVLDLAGKRYAGWKEITSHGPEEDFSFTSEGVGT